MSRRVHLLGVVVVLGLVARAACAGSVEGEIELGVPGLTLADVAPVVVFVEPTDEAGLSQPVPSPATIRQHHARFEPSLLIVVRGQTVEMPNDDVIFHNVFSFSERLKTVAARLPDKVRREAINERSADLRARAAALKLAFHRENLGREVDVLMETIDEDGYRKGLTGNYLRVAVDPDSAAENDLVRVRLERAEGDYCFGRVVGPRQ